jgi:uncharacterized protein (TIGR00730 family)
MQRVCVFCGSSAGARPAYTAAARALGATLAAQGLGLVYGGANVGLMKAVADAALAAGGEVIGVIPESLMARELGHPGLSALHVVSSMHTRKALMADQADAFVALPGGFGTFEEFFEVVTWTQLGLHAKPCGLLNVAGFYDPLLAFLDHASAERFIKAETRGIVVADDDPAALLDRLRTMTVPQVPKWITEEERCRGAGADAPAIQLTLSALRSPLRASAAASAAARRGDSTRPSAGRRTARRGRPPPRPRPAGDA